MDIFRNALKSWTRRDPQSTSNPPSPEMSRHCGTPTPTPTPPPTNHDNGDLIPTSSPLSSLPTTDSFTTAAAASPGDTPKAGSPNPEPEDESDFGDDNDDEEEEVEDKIAVDGRDRGDEDAESPQYHNASPLPPELKEHCRVYLEEALRMSHRICPNVAYHLHAIRIPSFGGDRGLVHLC